MPDERPAMGEVPSVSEVRAVLDAAYPPALAQPWDAVGLACGDPTERVRRILVCVDPVAATVDEAIGSGAQLLVAHHPLLLRGVHGVGADTAKGALVHRMVRAGVALHCAHTNADAADPGVSDALAAAIGLTVHAALVPRGEPATGGGVTGTGGAENGGIGDSGGGSGTGGSGTGARTGMGRIGELPAAEPLHQFVDRVAAALPETEPGVCGAGEPDRLVRRVAVVGGAGDSFLDAATAAGVDAYVTADLRHHPVSEHLEAAAGERAPALVGVTHWASEWPWCAQVAELLRAQLPGTVEVDVSRRRTDPWTLRAGP